MQPSQPARDPSGHPPLLPHRGTGTRVWLVRHAEVHEDWQGKAYGCLDVPLSEDGLARTRQFAKALGSLPPDAVMSSPLQRAKQLADGIVETSGAPLTVDERLAEINRGDWQGLRVEELHERFEDEVRLFYGDPWSYRGHGGENDAMVFERAFAALDQALVDSGSERSLVFTTHYNVIRVLTARALDIDPARSFGLRVDPAHGVMLVDGANG